MCGEGRVLDCAGNLPPLYAKRGGTTRESKSDLVVTCEGVMGLGIKIGPAGM